MGVLLPVEPSVRAGRVGRAVRGWAGAALDLVLPVDCPGCGGAGPLCHGCGAGLAGRLRSVVLDPHALDVAAGVALPPVLALDRYAGPVRAAILAGKEGARRDLPPVLGAAVGRAWLRRHRGGPVPRDGVWIVPAPSRRAAARARGGDPVAAMAGAFARELARCGVPAGVAPCLRTAGRARDSVGLDPAQRARNLAGRIRLLASGVPPPGADVVLLDDVVTSGATVVHAVLALTQGDIPVIESVAVASAARWVSPQRRG